eukprot:12429613-Karenia_brevis.AAC.1
MTVVMKSTTVMMEAVQFPRSDPHQNPGGSRVLDPMQHVCQCTPVAAGRVRLRARESKHNPPGGSAGYDADQNEC